MFVTKKVVKQKSNLLVLWKNINKGQTLHETCARIITLQFRKLDFNALINYSHESVLVR